MKQEEPPTIVIKAPHNYERTHELTECPLCKSPDPYLDMYLPVREFGYFDLNLYVCSNGHKFSAKHEILKDAEHLKIYDRTHLRDIW